MIGPVERPLHRARKYYEPKKLRERHKLIIRLHACGMTNAQIAEVLGYTPARVSVILNDPRGSAVKNEAASIIAEGLDDVTLRLQYHANEALDKVVELMRDASSETVQQKSAFDILDRAGYNKVDKQITATAKISDDKLEKLMTTMHETKQILDADYTVED